LRGVIELGAVGFNAYLLRVDQQRHWHLERAAFNQSYIIKNMATGEQIERGVRLYAQQLLNAGVARPDLHVVISSGAAQAQVTAGLARQLQAASYQVTTVTPEQEGSYDLAAVLPPELAAGAFVVDLGSGNTKICWLDAQGQPHTALTYGARYHESVVLQTPAVLADVRAKAGQVPVGQRRRCFLMGGTAYELARPLRRGTERYTVLTGAAWQLPAADGPPPAGLLLLRALAEATGCQQFIFDWDASFAVGYLLARP